MGQENRSAFRLALAGHPEPLLQRLAVSLKELNPGWEVQLTAVDGAAWGAAASALRWEAAVYFADRGRPRRPGPDLDHARRFFEAFSALAIPRVAVVSSSAVFEPSHHHPGMASESAPLLSRRKSDIAETWRRLEALARELLSNTKSLTILRPAVLLFPGGEDYFNRFFGSWAAPVLPGHDPPLQLLDWGDFVSALSAALSQSRPSAAIWHLAPSRVIPLRKALRLSRTLALPFPRTLQRPSRWILSALGRSFPIAQLDYIRYSWTLQGDRFAARHSSADALRQSGLAASAHPPSQGENFDDFGMDPEYIRRLSRGAFRFLHDRYWRIETRGLENVPAEGGAVLVGIHRGFMPFDAVMALHELFTLRGRLPRFLIHPGLVKFPFFFDFITRLGGVLACRANADRLLRAGHIVGVLPEGVRGAFAMYREGYRLKRFTNNEFVRLALRRRVPILPFVTIGSAETHPILGRIDSAWWRRYSEWPFFPLTPTFPWLPVPLPSKWHTRYLEPIPVQRLHPPEAAQDPRVVRSIALQTRRVLQSTADEMLARRRSTFFGAFF